jgi:hypothetical protein
MISVTTETKAVLNAERGRVVGFVKSDEPGTISLAVPADRAVMTPQQARELAAWLVEEASKADQPASKKLTIWESQEAELQREIKRNMDSQAPWSLWPTS